MSKRRPAEDAASTKSSEQVPPAADSAGSETTDIPLTLEQTESTEQKASQGSFKVGDNSEPYAVALLSAVHMFGLPTTDKDPNRDPTEGAPHSPLTDKEGKLNEEGVLYLNAMHNMLGIYRKNPDAPDTAMKDAMVQLCEESAAKQEFKDRLKGLSKEGRDIEKERTIKIAKSMLSGNIGIVKEYKADGKKQKEPSKASKNEVGPGATTTPHWSADGKTFTMVIRTESDGRYLAKQILDKYNYDPTGKYVFNLATNSYRANPGAPSKESVGWVAACGVMAKAQESNCFNFVPTDSHGRELTIDHLLDDFPTDLKGQGRVNAVYIQDGKTKESRFQNARHPEFAGYERFAERLYLKDVYKCAIAANLARTGHPDYDKSETFDPNDPVAVHLAMLKAIDEPANQRIAMLKQSLEKPDVTPEEKTELEARIKEAEVLRQRAAVRFQKDIAAKPVVAMAVINTVDYDHFTSVKLEKGKLVSKYGRAPSASDFNRKLRGETEADTDPLGGKYGAVPKEGAAPCVSIDVYMARVKAEYLEDFRKGYVATNKNTAKLRVQKKTAILKKEKAKYPELQNEKSFRKSQKKEGASDEEVQAKIDAANAEYKAKEQELDKEIEALKQKETAEQEMAADIKAGLAARSHVLNPETTAMLKANFEQEYLDSQAVEVHLEDAAGVSNDDMDAKVVELLDKEKNKDLNADATQSCTRAKKIVAANSAEEGFSNPLADAKQNLDRFEERLEELKSQQSSATESLGATDRPEATKVDAALLAANKENVSDNSLSDTTSPGITPGGGGGGPSL